MIMIRTLEFHDKKDINESPVNTPIGKVTKAVYRDGTAYLGPSINGDDGHREAVVYYSVSGKQHTFSGDVISVDPFGAAEDDMQPHLRLTMVGKRGVKNASFGTYIHDLKSR